MRSTRHRWWSFFLVLAITILAGFLVYPNDFGLSAAICKIGDLPGDLRRILALSELVAHGSGVILLLAVIWYLAPHLRLHLPRVAACAFVAGLAANGIKLIHGRLRPLSCPPGVTDAASTWRGWFPATSDTLQQPYEYAVQSFPSAHSATAMGFAIGLSWLYPRGRHLFYTVAILAGLQRIVFLAHWPSDVVFGAATGVFFGACFTLPGMLGNSVFNWLERKTGRGRNALVPSVTGQDKRLPGKRAA